MPMKITCPACGRPVPLTRPYPAPGSVVQCPQCGVGSALSYPQGTIDALERRGERFADDRPAPRSATRASRAPADPTAADIDRLSDAAVPRATLPRLPTDPGPLTSAATEVFEDPVAKDVDSVIATEMDATSIDGTEVGEGPSADPFLTQERTVPAMRTPYGALPGGIPEADSPHHVVARWVDDEEDPALAPVKLPAAAPAASAGTPRPKGTPAAAPAKSASPAKSAGPAKGAAPPKGSTPTKRAPKAAAAPPKKRGILGRLGCFGGGCFTTFGAIALVLLVLGGASAGGVYYYYSQDLPTIEKLRAYQPPTVTTVHDRDGKLLGEIYEQRRYVRPLEEIPKVVQDAFVAAEDNNFWDHGGVDYMGIVRAFLRNAASGRKAQGASTITQQVAKNFLLTRDKAIERKIKEVILSWRIESAYSKEHILYLYLNEIYLGSQAYGVEAASRTYFGKSVDQITVAEAAILAGLPPRPSDYGPHKSWEKARARQEYVLSRMLANNYIDQATYDAALAEKITVVARTNSFLEQAPHFTEYARRYLVDKYGEERVLNGGLKVTTTCDIDLQKVAQKAVTEQVSEVDQRMGFRREKLETLKDDAAIAERRKKQELSRRTAQRDELDAAGGRTALPEHAEVRADEITEAVVLEVAKTWVKLGIGDKEALAPISWSDWLYVPNPRMSYRFRDTKDLTVSVDVDGDGTKDGAIIRKGDVLDVKVIATSTKDAAVAKAFKGTPGESADLIAVRLWQTPEVEGAMLSMDVADGSVRAMVGGADFGRSQFNRAVQSRRQVGSTFKPIVYAAALATKRVTTASMVTDAPLAFATEADFVWKPANYGNDYMGDITLRKALALSRNTCTVRVLETIDPGMNNDIVYKFARGLGIGGPALYTLPEGYVPTPENDQLCPWTRETKASTICMDRFPEKDPALSNTAHRAQLGPDDVYMCRACDMSMGLGSASLTMEELVRAYAAFADGGELLTPRYITEVKDRDGKILETIDPAPPVRVMDPEVATLTTWLLQSVASEGTAAEAKAKLKLTGLAGKTGTTNDEKDAWFIGFTNDVVTAAWVGFDQPAPLGVSSTGGRTALPIWIDYMRVAAPADKDRPFPMRGDIEYGLIDESTGRHVSSGGRTYPFIRGTVPASTGTAAGQVTLQDLTTDL